MQTHDSVESTVPAGNVCDMQTYDSDESTVAGNVCDMQTYDSDESITKTFHAILRCVSDESLTSTVHSGRSGRFFADTTVRVGLVKGVGLIAIKSRKTKTEIRQRSIDDLLRREACVGFLASRAFSHMGIVPMVFEECFESPGGIHMVTEFVGVSSEQYLTQTNLASACASFALSVFDVLMVFRERGFHHGDAHMSNIRVIQQNQVCFIDFENSCFVDEQGAEQEQKTRIANFYSLTDIRRFWGSLRKFLSDLSMLGRLDAREFLERPGVHQMITCSDEKNSIRGHPCLRCCNDTTEEWYLQIRACLAESYTF